MNKFLLLIICFLIGIFIYSMMQKYCMCSIFEGNTVYLSFDWVCESNRQIQQVSAEIEDLPPQRGRRPAAATPPQPLPLPCVTNTNILEVTGCLFKTSSSNLLNVYYPDLDWYIYLGHNTPIFSDRGSDEVDIVFTGSGIAKSCTSDMPDLDQCVVDVTFGCTSNDGTSIDPYIDFIAYNKLTDDLGNLLITDPTILTLLEYGGDPNMKTFIDINNMGVLGVSRGNDLGHPGQIINDVDFTSILSAKKVHVGKGNNHDFTKIFSVGDHRPVNNKTYWEITDDRLSKYGHGPEAQREFKVVEVTAVSVKMDWGSYNKNLPGPHPNDDYWEPGTQRPTTVKTTFDLNGILPMNFYLERSPAVCSDIGGRI
jgi:hypothetical protein